MDCKEVFCKCRIIVIKKQQNLSHSDVLSDTKNLDFNNSLSDSINCIYCHQCRNNCVECQQRSGNNNINSLVRRRRFRGKYTPESNDNIFSNWNEYENGSCEC